MLFWKHCSLKCVKTTIIVKKKKSLLVEAHQSQHVTILPPCGDYLKYYKDRGGKCGVKGPWSASFLFVSAWQVTSCGQTGLGWASNVAAPLLGGAVAWSERVLRKQGFPATFRKEKVQPISNRERTFSPSHCHSFNFRSAQSSGDFQLLVVGWHLEMSYWLQDSIRLASKPSLDLDWSWTEI